MLTIVKFIYREPTFLHATLLWATIHVSCHYANTCAVGLGAFCYTCSLAVQMPARNARSLEWD